jgi:hypothetical protein
MVLSQFPQPGAEQKQVIYFSAKTAIRKLFNSIFLHNLFLLKILAIKKATQALFPAFWQNLHSKNGLFKHLISFAFLINQQRIGATHFKIKHSDSCFSIASIYSASFFAEFSWANEFLTTNKKSETNMIISLLTKNSFQRTVF